jgi:flavin-binding protein dodecin
VSSALAGSYRHGDAATWLQRAHNASGAGFLLCLIASSENNACMSDHVYKKIEVVGSSPNGFEEAIKNALARAEKTVRNMRWFEVTETRGDVEDGKVGHWQVTLKIGFTLEK